MIQALDILKTDKKEWNFPVIAVDFTQEIKRIKVEIWVTDVYFQDGEWIFSGMDIEKIELLDTIYFKNTDKWNYNDILLSVIVHLSEKYNILFSTI